MIDEHPETVVTGTIVVQLEPYRERRRLRRNAAGFLFGYLLGAWLLPAAAELLEAWLTSEELASNNGVDRVAAYTHTNDE
jgi:hypothetical protein